MFVHFSILCSLLCFLVSVALCCIFDSFDRKHKLASSDDSSLTEGASKGKKSHKHKVQLPTTSTKKFVFLICFRIVFFCGVCVNCIKLWK